MKKIVVVGLGYVGLPLALLADRKGYEAIGIDIDNRKIDALKVGNSYITDISDEELRASNATFTTDASSVIKTADVVAICVQTPVDENKQPDLRPIESA